MSKLEIEKSEHWSVIIPSGSWGDLGADIEEIEEFGVNIEELPALNIVAMYEKTSSSDTATINFYYRFENYGVLYHTFGIVPEADMSTEDIVLSWIPAIFSGGYIDWEELLDHL